MSPRNNRLLLIDALNLIRRIYAAQPGEDGPDRVEGAKTSMLQSLARALRECDPTHAAVVFDGGGPSWRHELYPDYKAGHAGMPEALAEGLAGYREAIAAAGVRVLSLAGFEADDVIATAAHKAAAAGVEVIILSNDKSFLQLLPEGIYVRDHFEGVNRDEAHVEKRFGVLPEKLADCLALAGDPGNGIAGVKGVGTKTAARLLAEHGALDGVLASAETIRGKLGERLREGSDSARLCRKLVALRTDLELGTNLNELRYRPLEG